MMTEVTHSQLMNFSSKDANDLQGEIENFTKKIEHEKINYRLCEERYQKQLENYNILCGKPKPKTKDQKEKERKEKEKTLEKNVSQKIQKRDKKETADSENDLTFHQQESERLTTEINNILLENKDLRKKIEDLRKEKLAVSSLLDSLKNQRDSLKNKYEELLKCNEEALKKMKCNDIEKVKKEGFEKRFDFEENRDGLEEKFHEILEENIKRSRDLKKEAQKKRFHYNLKQDDEQAKLLAEDDISDRTPILDILIEKWKFYNKFKRQMLEKYIKNSIAIKDAFENMRKYLGIDDYQELPVVLEKMEEQMSSIEMFISKLTNDLDLLEERKRSIENKIQLLTIKNNKNTETKNTFVESKKNHITKLRTYIKDLKDDIEQKRTFFTKLQPFTEDFLIFMQSTYISEYVPEKIAINKDVAFSESNIVQILANVEDYQKILEEFQLNNEGYFDKKSDVLINKDIEKLKNDMRTKLDQFRKDNLYNNFKLDNKTPVSFDETIKKMADEIVKVVNSQNIGKINDKKKK